MSEITKEEREEIRKRCEAATPAPWVVMDSVITTAKCVFSEAKRRYSNDYDICTTATDGAADGAFIAHARQDIPRLLDALDEAEITIEEYKKVLKKLFVRSESLASAAKALLNLEVNGIEREDNRNPDERVSFGILRQLRL